MKSMNSGSMGSGSMGLTHSAHRGNGLLLGGLLSTRFLLYTAVGTGIVLGAYFLYKKFLKTEEAIPSKPAEAK